MIDEADLPAIPADTKALFFGGISLISEPAADSYAALLAKGAGDCIVMMDPNIRPAFIKDVDTYKARLTKMLSQTDVVKTSDEDLEWLFPEAASIEDAIKQMQAMGPKMVLFTEGAKGATVYRDGQEPVFVPSVRTEVVDTVGAGDTFNGGFLAALHKNGLLEKSSVLAMTEQQIQTVVSFAAKCAAISVSRAGAQPPWVHEVS
jgi:fructokinase